MQRSFCTILMLLMLTLHTHAQNGCVAWDEVGFVYAQEKFQRTYRTYLETYGEYVSPLEPVRFPVASDSLFGWIRQAMGMPDPSLSKPFQGEIDAWTLASIDGRTDWLAQFGDVQWAYLGNNFFTPLDTLATPEIRAHLEAYFGPPTQTAVETKQSDATPSDENGQFEYWFVVNDSIPMMVMDVRGPFDRGVIVATDQRFRSFLYRMRQSLLAAAMRRTEPAPYVDYYYNFVTEKWYSTGYDGSEYFLNQIRRPNLTLGRPVQAPS